MRAANVDTLLEVPGITTKVAEKIYAFFQQAHETDAEES
jgi:Holliday junction resolvasome RuvABC DNA-binding subunit